MKIKHKNLLKSMIILMIIFQISFVLAQDIDLRINISSSFQEKDPVYFFYELLSDVETKLIVTSGIECPEFYAPPADATEFELKSNDILYEVYNPGIVVTESVKPQTCTAYVEVLGPVQQKTEKTFIINTVPYFEFDLVLNKNKFEQDEEILIYYESELQDPETTTTLTFPDKSIIELELPATIMPEQTGTYEIQSTASKNGYITQESTEQFSVIEEEIVEETFFDMFMEPEPVEPIIKHKTMQEGFEDIDVIDDEDDVLDEEELLEIEQELIDAIEQESEITQEQQQTGQIEQTQTQQQEQETTTDTQQTQEQTQEQKPKQTKIIIFAIITAFIVLALLGLLMMRMVKRNV